MYGMIDHVLVLDAALLNRKAGRNRGISRMCCVTTLIFFIMLEILVVLPTVLMIIYFIIDTFNDPRSKTRPLFLKSPSNCRNRILENFS